MNDWTDGYRADIDYTYGYYAELNPQRIIMAFLNQGLVFPEVGTACELGFGQGLSANIHAAASVIEWHGTDFNPSQASFAQELAAASGADAHWHDQSFAEFASRTDLPDFDYIALHGIWSWISDENRQVITEFIRKKLKVGGVLYLSYNTQPGWAAFAPMRHLMNEHAHLMGCGERDVAGRVNAAINFAEKLLATQPLFSRANPLAAERLQTLKGHSRNYLAHEYFNRDWCPMHFATMAQWLEGAKMHYACSAHYLSHIDMLNLTAEQQAFLNDIPDPLFRETTRDFMINQQFRRDYWVKGSRKLNTFERVQALRAQKVILTSHRPDVQLSVTGVLGEANMSADVYMPLLDALADHKVLSLGNIEGLLQDKDINFSQIVQAIMVLMSAGHMALVQNDASIAKTKQQTDKLNALLCHKALGGDEIAFLASPVTGGGIAVNRFQQLFLLSRAQGQSQPSEWAQAAWQSIAAQGQKLVKEGVMLESAEENLAELTAQALLFAEKQLPILKALQII